MNSSFEEFKNNYKEFNEDYGLSEPVDENEEIWKLTTEGVRLVLELYERAKSGQPIEQIESELDIDPSDDHLEFRILMAIGGISGLLDTYDEALEMSERLDEIEQEYR